MTVAFESRWVLLLLGIGFSLMFFGVFKNYRGGARFLPGFMFPIALFLISFSFIVMMPMVMRIQQDSPSPQPTGTFAKARQGTPLFQRPAPPDGPRPEWVDATGADAGIRISCGPYVSLEECQAAEDLEIFKASEQYIDEHLGAGASALVAKPIRYLHKHAVTAEWLETIESPSLGPMYQLHAKLEFDETAQQDFAAWHRDTVRNQRLAYVGSGAVGTLAVLGIAFLALRRSPAKST